MYLYVCMYTMTLLGHSIPQIIPIRLVDLKRVDYRKYTSDTAAQTSTTPQTKIEAKRGPPVPAGQQRHPMQQPVVS